MVQSPAGGCFVFKIIPTSIGRILAVHFLAGTGAVSVAQSNISFELNADKYNTGGGALVTGDFNNDGNPDITPVH